VLLGAAVASTGHAYRPFDSTDAAVAPSGELELELGPVGYLREGDRQFLTAPGVILNLGLFRGWELVLQGRHLVLLGDTAGEPRSRLLDTGLFAKGVLRAGSLQDGRGPSVGIELGPLLPTVNGDTGWGVVGAAILSQRWRPLALHVNAAGALTRAHNFDLFGGLILEGPAHWRVRPVAEVFVEREFNVSFTYSGLVGAIWRVGEHLSLDAGMRAARTTSATILEARAGLTWSFRLWGATAK
jgi:hypothetical protein